MVVNDGCLLVLDIMLIEIVDIGYYKCFVMCGLCCIMCLVYVVVLGKRIDFDLGFLWFCVI